MTSFNRQDRSGSVQDVLVLDERRATDVRADTDELDQACSCGHSCNVTENGVEVELAAADGRRARGGKSSLELGRVRRLVALDARKLLDGDLSIGEACSGEVGFLEFGQRLRIEGALELLEDVGELCMAYWLARGNTKRE